MIRRMLHPTDFSSASRPAFTHAVAMSRANRATLIALNVMLTVRGK